MAPWREVTGDIGHAVTSCSRCAMRLRKKCGSAPVLALFDPVLQKPGHARIEISRFHHIETQLILVVLIHDGLGDLADHLLQRFAVFLRMERRQLPFERAGMGAGNFRVPFLVALDIGKQRIPDESQLRRGPAAVFPLRQEDAGVQHHLGGSNAAQAVFFDIGEFAAEFDLGGPWMARAGVARQRTVLGKLPVEVGGGFAADRKIGIGLAHDGLGKS